jgi:hypothetical protein
VIIGNNNTHCQKIKILVCCYLKWHVDSQIIKKMLAIIVVIAIIQIIIILLLNKCTNCAFDMYIVYIHAFFLFLLNSLKILKILLNFFISLFPWHDLSLIT